jgi:hypothetical protein
LLLFFGPPSTCQQLKDLVKSGGTNKLEALDGIFNALPLASTPSIIGTYKGMNLAPNSKSPDAIGWRKKDLYA